MPDAALLSEVDGYFVKGVDSYTSPDALLQSELVAAMNTVNRGGLIQTRPGTRTMACLPIGNRQGFTAFTPENGVPHLVAAVDGLVYVSAPPFTQFRQLPNIQFSPTARYVSFAVCQQSTDYTDDGTLIFLDNAFSVLVMQDGLSRAAFWDGGTSRHLNPSPSNQSATLPLRDETRIGLWQAWAGDRLWVSRGNRVFASDIGNPLKFTETQYVAEARSFYLTSECTGMIETPDKQGLLVFTKDNVTLFQSSIRDRTAWLSTDKFQEIVLPSIGCVAPRSIKVQYGYVWWFSASGVVNFNAAARSNVTSRIDYQDLEMSGSKWNLGSDLSGICAISHENYLLMSVPNGDIYNRHTWCLDQATFDGGENSWNGYWTGWRPVEWAKIIVDGSERVFFLSIDYDGYNRVWEAFLDERKDNGCAIACFAQLREHTFGTVDLKRFKYAKIFAREIAGDVGVAAFVSGQKGGWQRILTKEIVANEGQVYGDETYSDSVLLAGNRPQTRVFKTAEYRESNDCNQCGVEADEPNVVDRAFSLLVVWDGIFGINKYSMVAIPESEPDDDGRCEPNEVGPRSLSDLGCAAKSKFVTSEQPLEPFVTGATVTEVAADGSEATASADGESVVSEASAQRRAECRAGLRARAILDAGLVGIETAWYYSIQSGEHGFSVAQGNPFASIGGYISTTQWPGGSLHDLLDTITFQENEAKTVDYRCVFIRNLDTIEAWRNVRVYIGGQTEGGADVAIGVDPIGPVSPFTEAFQSTTIPNETTAPSGVTFSVATSYSTGISIGNINPGDCVAIWVRRTALGEDVISGDSAVLVAEGDVQ